MINSTYFSGTGEQCDNGIFYHECLIGRCCKMGDKWKCIDPIGVDPFGPDPFAKCDSMSQYKLVYYNTLFLNLTTGTFYDVKNKTK